MISLIRDYLDVLSNIVNSSSNYLDVIEVTLKFGFDSLIKLVGYIVTFGWLRDMMYLPIEIMKWEESVLTGKVFYEELNINWSSLVNPGNENEIIGIFFLGFVNSLFCSLPFSTSHFVALRRVYVQGLTAGLVSTAGLIVGQSLFIFCTIFGIRWAVISWFSLDALSYVVGIFLIFQVAYEMSAERQARLILNSEWKVLQKFFLINVLLAWTEQSACCQYLRNVTLTNHPSLLTLGGEGSLLDNSSYLLGIVLGQIFFSGVFIGLSVVLKNSLIALTPIPYTVWLNRANKVLLIVIVGLSLSSTPYYGLDYLFLGPLGLVSEDKLLNDSFLTQKNAKDLPKVLTGNDFVYPLSVDTDNSYFDRGDYGSDQTGFFRRSFEELNYQGEYSWVIRRDKKPNLYAASGQTAEEAIRDLFQPALEKVGEKVEVDKSRDVYVLDGMDEVDREKFATDLDRQRLEKRSIESNESRMQDTYLMGESFNNFPELKKQVIPLEANLKDKFYSNPVYKTLLNLEIDSFLNRDKNSVKLDVIDENEIYKKRVILSKYYDTIREYQKMPFQREFNEVFHGSKSFVDRAYNHQFKGTLSVIRRLFAVTLDNAENPSQLSVLKYDKPLWRNSESESLNLMHEELRPLSSDVSSPFLKEADSIPFYLGWDNDERQMILTKRFTPITNKIQVNVKKDEMPGSNWHVNLKTVGSPRNESIVFTTWPLEKDLLLALKAKPTNEVVTLFEPTTNPDMNALFKLTHGDSGTFELYNFPANMRYIGKTAENLSPQQGGFLWPGSEYKNQLNHP